MCLHRVGRRRASEDRLLTLTTCCRQDDFEAAAGPGIAHAYAPGVRFHDAAGDRQAEPGALGRSGGGCVASAPSDIEDAVEIRVSEATASVAHGEHRAVLA